MDGLPLDRRSFGHPWITARRQWSAAGCVVAAGLVLDARRPGCAAEEEATLRCTAAAAAVPQPFMAADGAGESISTPRKSQSLGALGRAVCTSFFLEYHGIDPL